MRRVRALTLAALAGVALSTVPAAAQSAPCTDHTISNETVTSQAADAITVAITVFKPCTATAQNPVPVILSSHGWGGSRAKSGMATEMAQGFAVVSIDQRGHGESGGQANVQDPALEAQDVKSVIDHVAAKDWVRKDVDAEGNAIADDPVLFAVGGSYGGGYQMMTALTEVRESGRTRFNALAPEITWFNLSQSLAPNGVPRTIWGTLLYGAGNATVDMAQFIHETFAYSASTGQWPNGAVLGVGDPSGALPNADKIYKAHSPFGFVLGKDKVQLDIPVIWRQGITDGLFPLNEGLHNFTRSFTTAAQNRSVFVGYNGGHVLPSAYPVHATAGGDQCSVGGFGELTRSFFKAVADGAADPSAVLFAKHPELRRFNFTTDDSSACVRMDTLPQLQPRGVGQDVGFNDSWTTVSGAGPAVYLEVPDIPAGATVAGLPRLSGKVTVAGVDQRAFFALAKGTSDTDAKILAANVQPLRVNAPSTSIQEDFEIELPGVAVTLAPSEKLYLMVSGTSDQFIGHGSRAPGWMGFTDLRVSVPVVQ